METDRYRLSDLSWLITDWLADFGWWVSRPLPDGRLRFCIRWLFCGMPRCYSMAPWGTSFCKRRTGHWGQCGNSGRHYRWNKPVPTSDTTHD